jgi:hypothetical protein
VQVDEPAPLVAARPEHAHGHTVGVLVAHRGDVGRRPEQDGSGFVVLASHLRQVGVAGYRDRGGGERLEMGGNIGIERHGAIVFASHACQPAG